MRTAGKQHNLFDLGPDLTVPGMDPLARVPVSSPVATLHAGTQPDNPEKVVRDEVLDGLESSRSRIIDYLRDRMRTLYARRMAAEGYRLACVTADDARHILDNDPRFPGPQEFNRNFLGCLFREEGWEWTGNLAYSRTPGSHANLIRCWRWVGVKA